MLCLLQWYKQSLHFILLIIIFLCNILLETKYKKKHTNFSHVLNLTITLPIFMQSLYLKSIISNLNSFLSHSHLICLNFLYVMIMIGSNQLLLFPFISWIKFSKSTPFFVIFFIFFYLDMKRGNTLKIITNWCKFIICKN